MPRGPAKKRLISSAAGVTLRGLNFIFDSFGATRPIRLGLTIALSLTLGLPAKMLATYYAVVIPSDVTLYAAFFGVSFILLFAPLLIWPGLPEPLLLKIAAIEQLATKSGLSKAAKRKLYFRELESFINTNGNLESLDLKGIKEEDEASHEK
jgi:hypothetical protein